ncbi:MAG: MFS transporter, partial [Patulibacter sp.]
MTRSTAIVVVAAVAFGLVLLQTTAVNLALPAIRDALDADVDGLQWCASAYAVIVASTLLPAGVVCDRIGASRGLAIGLVVLIAGAVVSSSAPSVAVIVVGQGIAGLGA